MGKLLKLFGKAAKYKVDRQALQALDDRPALAEQQDSHPPRAAGKASGIAVGLSL
jgi:hypothetical protein